MSTRFNAIFCAADSRFQVISVEGAAIFYLDAIKTPPWITTVVIPIGT